MKTSPTAAVQRGLNVQVLMTTAVSTSQWCIKLQRLATHTYALLSCGKLLLPHGTLWNIATYGRRCKIFLASSY